MAPQFPAQIWHNGKLKPWAEATTHVMAHALHYGSSIFEGIRSYPTPKGVVIFRLADHMKRFFNSAKIYDLAMPYDAPTIAEACREVVRINQLHRSYIRPVAFRGLGQSLSLSAECPTDVAVGAWEMGGYLGNDVVEKGIEACVSTWQRFAPNTLPAGAKAGGNYLS
ncbi:MAG: aminotransferase class IV, partial [Gemmataceae bacterium]